MITLNDSGEFFGCLDVDVFAPDSEDIRVTDDPMADIRVSDTPGLSAGIWAVYNSTEGQPEDKRLAKLETPYRSIGVLANCRLEVGN